MSAGWVKLDTFGQLHEAELLTGFLEENGIQAVVLNKKDSSYMFGDISVCVQENMLSKAKEVIQKLENIE